MTFEPGMTGSDWERQLKALLPLYGHRNWIVVADSAYPAQSKPGIETIVSGAGQLQVVRKMLDAIDTSKHVRANVYLDEELQYVPEADAPGVTRYRTELAELLTTAVTTTMPHEQVIAKLDHSAQVFRVLLIKTELTIPYTSVFFELDCGYWNAAAEQRLRQAMLVSDSR